MSTIKLKRSNVPGKAPLPGDLELGELAVNTADGSLFLKKNDGTIKPVGDAALRQELAGSTDSQGSDLVVHTGTGETVTEALDKRAICVGSMSELEGLSLSEGVNVYLTEDGRAGEFVVKVGTPPGDPKSAIYIALSNGNYAERLDKSNITVKMFGATGDGVTDDTGAFDAASASGLPIDVPPGDYYLTKNYAQRNWTALRGGVQFTNAGWRVSEFGFSLSGRGDQQSVISSTHTIDRGSARQELRIYQGNGAGMHLYGNEDIQHAGNIAFITGPVGSAAARMIVSGYGALAGSDGERSNTDTRVTIGNNIWNFVDDNRDHGLLTLRRPAHGKPTIYFADLLDEYATIATPTSQRLRIGQFNEDNGLFYNKLEIGTTGNFYPYNDNANVCGAASYRWSTVYSATGSINTSDGRDKEQIGPIPDEVLDAWGDVEYVRYKWKSAVEEKGDGARWHAGLVAQQVEKAFADRGLDAFEWGLLCYDEWDAEDEIEAGNRYSVRPAECESMEAAWVRRQLSKL